MKANNYLKLIIVIVAIIVVILGIWKGLSFGRRAVNETEDAYTFWMETYDDSMTLDK